VYFHECLSVEVPKRRCEQLRPLVFWAVVGTFCIQVPFLVQEGAAEQRWRRDRTGALRVLACPAPLPSDTRWMKVGRVAACVHTFPSKSPQPVVVAGEHCSRAGEHSQGPDPGWETQPRERFLCRPRSLVWGLCLLYCCTQKERTGNDGVFYFLCCCRHRCQVTEFAVNKSAV